MYPAQACFIRLRTSFLERRSRIIPFGGGLANKRRIARSHALADARGLCRHAQPRAGDEFLRSLARLELGDTMLQANLQLAIDGWQKAIGGRGTHAFGDAVCFECAAREHGDELTVFDIIHQPTSARYQTLAGRGMVPSCTIPGLNPTSVVRFLRFVPNSIGAKCLKSQCFLARRVTPEPKVTGSTPVGHTSLNRPRSSSTPAPAGVFSLSPADPSPEQLFLTRPQFRPPTPVSRYIRRYIRGASAVGPGPFGEPGSVEGGVPVGSVSRADRGGRIPEADVGVVGLSSA